MEENKFTFEEDALGRIIVTDPSCVAESPTFVIDPQNLPLTTDIRDSGFSVAEDVAYQIAVAHYGYRDNRGAFWCWRKDNTAMKQLHKQVFGEVDETPAQVVKRVSSSWVKVGHRQDNTRQNQKKKAKRRKTVLKNHR